MRGMQSRARSGERGGALIVAIVAVFVLAGMTGAMLTLSTASQRENRAAIDHMQALYVAEAGLSRAIGRLEADNPEVAFGSADDPLPFGNGGFWGTSNDNGDDTWTLTAFGTSDALTRGVQCVMVAQLSPIYDHALFAGNSSGDPAYTLDFGGCGSQADYIDGPVYSGNDVLIACDADVEGPIHAVGTIAGGSGTEGLSQPIPDIPGMNYAVNHDFDVAAELASAAAVWSSSGGYGGSAWQLPEDNPCHIFRKNPDDRAANTSTTPKDDYFLEDPYETMQTTNVIDPSAGTHITVSGLGGAPGPSGNDAVYYIDGNLWIHNRSIYSFTLYDPGPDGVRLTFVVSGNIYISDNIFYDNAIESGLALIAVVDPLEPDSGNIYFGDQVFGTLEHMSAFMYAENDFYDNNLSATGSATVTVHGNMTAGNQVDINRDFAGQHSQLTVEFDQRIVNHTLTLPGLPGQTGTIEGWTLAAWREVPVP